MNYLILILLIAILWYLHKNRKMMKDLTNDVFEINHAIDKMQMEEGTIYIPNQKEDPNGKVGIIHHAHFASKDPICESYLGPSEYYEQAKELAIAQGKISATVLQRRLRIGYARAARLLDELEEEGIVGPADGARSRKVLVKSNTNE